MANKMGPGDNHVHLEAGPSWLDLQMRAPPGRHPDHCPAMPWSRGPARHVQASSPWRLRRHLCLVLWGGLALLLQPSPPEADGPASRVPTSASP